MFASPTKQSTFTANRLLSWWLIFLLVIATTLCLGLGSIVCQPQAEAMTCWEKVYGNGDPRPLYCMTEYNNKLYAGFGDARVKRYDGSTWQQVNTDCFGDFSNARALAMEVFNGMLFVGTHNSNTGAEVWAYDGNSWTQVNQDGFSGDSSLWYCKNLCVYDGSLYAGVYSNYDGCRVFRYDGGTNWTQVNNPGFGDNNNDPLAMISWNNHLWVGTENTTTGTEIWRHDGTNWIQTNSNGFSSSDTKWTNVLCVYNNKLYAGTTTSLDSHEAS